MKREEPHQRRRPRVQPLRDRARGAAGGPAAPREVDEHWRLDFYFVNHLRSNKFHKPPTCTLEHTNITQQINIQSPMFVGGSAGACCTPAASATATRGRRSDSPDQRRLKKPNGALSTNQMKKAYPKNRQKHRGSTNESMPHATGGSARWSSSAARRRSPSASPTRSGAAARRCASIGPRP